MFGSICSLCFGMWQMVRVKVMEENPVRIDWLFRNWILAFFSPVFIHSCGSDSQFIGPSSCKHFQSPYHRFRQYQTKHCHLTCRFTEFFATWYRENRFECGSCDFIWRHKIEFRCTFSLHWTVIRCCRTADSAHPHTCSTLHSNRRLNVTCTDTFKCRKCDCNTLVLHK